MTELSARSRRGVVVAPHFLAVEAGRDVLAEGGNALEAVMAAAAAIIPAYPHMNHIGGDGFWRGDRGGGNRNAYPVVVGLIIAKFGAIAFSGALRVNEPMFGFRMDVHLGDWLAHWRVEMKADNEVMMHGMGVVPALLFGFEIPVRIKPVRIARSQK